MRNLRDHGIYRDRSVGTRNVPTVGWRQPEDFLQDRRPGAGYETVLVGAEIEAGVAVGRHTHPGIESAYVLEGGFELPIQGMETRMLKAGDAFFQVPPNTPHAGGKAGTAKARVLITYVVEKGKPLASPA